MKDYYTARELAGLHLPGVPTSVAGVFKAASREGWQRRKRSGRGGGWEYRTEFLPGDARAELAARALSARSASAAVSCAPEPSTSASANSSGRGAFSVRASGVIAASSSAPDPTTLKDWQRREAERKARIVAYIDREATLIGPERAMRQFLQLAAAGTLPPELQGIVARDERGGSALSRRTLLRWRRAAGAGFPALAPKASARAKQVPPWAEAFRVAYGRSQKPSVAEAVAELRRTLPAGSAAPSVSAAYRYLSHMHRTDRERGRMGSRELASIRSFMRRDPSELGPGGVYTADGHTFDAEIAHPAHGGPFRPEITVVADVYTRKVVGWSIGLAESSQNVAEALRKAVEAHGIPAIFYVDRGPGYRNNTLADETTGIAARLGISIEHSIAYRSQSRGVIERLHKTLWVRGAKRLPTYIGADMDPQAKQRAYRITRADVRASGSSRLLMPFPEFVKFVDALVAEYNARPHSSLRVNGKRASPDQMWQRALDEGFELVLVSAEEAADLFRPEVQRKALRGEIALFGNRYWDGALDAYHGEMVRVGYDVRDPSRVWVRDMEGRLVAIAGIDANKQPYFPKSVVDAAKEKRARGRARRLEEKLQEVRDEISPPALIEHAPIEAPSFAIAPPPERVEAPVVPEPAAATLDPEEMELPGRPPKPKSKYRVKWSDAKNRWVVMWPDVKEWFHERGHIPYDELLPHEQANFDRFAATDVYRTWYAPGRPKGPPLKKDGGDGEKPSSEEAGAEVVRATPAPVSVPARVGQPT